MIHTLSCASTARPIVCPSTQPFGSGFGQKGSTSNFGACSPAACTTARLLTMTDAVPRTAAAPTTATPTFTFLFIDDLALLGAHTPRETASGVYIVFPPKVNCADNVPGSCGRSTAVELGVRQPRLYDFLCSCGDPPPSRGGQRHRPGARRSLQPRVAGASAAGRRQGRAVPFARRC